MAEVIVTSDRKIIFTTVKLFSWSLVVFLLFLSHLNSSECANIGNPNSSSSISTSLTNKESYSSSSINSNQEITKKSDTFVNDDERTSKFSRVLLQKKPVQSETAEENIPLNNPETSSSANVPILSIASYLEQLRAKALASTTKTSRGDSLWNTIRVSFFQPIKNQIPHSSQNSVLAVPKLKTARQAWEDLVANAKTGFKGSYSPFQYTTSAPTTPSTTTTTTTIPPPQQYLKPVVTEDSLYNDTTQRSPRDTLPWNVDPATLAWDTIKLMGGISKDLLTSLYHHQIVEQNYKAFSPLKYFLLKPFIDAYQFKVGILNIYQKKLRDVAFATYIQHDSKFHKFKELINPTWFLPKPLPIHNHGWTEPKGEVVVIPPHHHHLITDASLIKRWIAAKISLKKHLFLTKLRLKKELLFDYLPLLLRIKVNFIRAVLLLIADKDKYAFIHALKILNHAVWKGTKKFLWVAFNLKDLKEDIIRDHLFSPPYGPHGPLAPVIGYDHVAVIHDPPPHHHSTPISPTTHSEVHPSVVPNNPLYSYPSESYKTIPDNEYNKPAQYQSSTPDPYQPPPKQTYHPSSSTYQPYQPPSPSTQKPYEPYQPPVPSQQYGAPPIQNYGQYQTTNYQHYNNVLPPVVDNPSSDKLTTSSINIPQTVVHNTNKTYATISTSSSSSGQPQVEQSSNSYAALASSSSSSSSSPSSEESRQEPSFFSKLVQSVMSPSIPTITESNRLNTEEQREGSRFSIQLLNSGFAHN